MKKIISILFHASQFTQAGNNWYTNFVSAELAEIEANPAGQFNPYGHGNTANSPIIALGEAWGYHMGHFLADRQYGVTSSCAGEQGICYNTGFIAGLNSHQIALEIFDPNLSPTLDPFHWIPKGLYYDLLDTRNENNPVVDQVSAYTNQQFFNAFNSNITSPGAYRQNLLTQNGNNQSVQVINLFQQYGY